MVVSDAAWLVKIGATIVRHGRYGVFQLAEVTVARSLFADIHSDRCVTVGCELLHRLSP